MMKIIISMLLSLGVIAGMTGCATPYGIDRKRDAADVFTMAVGIGAGAKARVGPAQTGLLADLSYTGLRGGTCFQTCSALPGEMDFNFLGMGIESYMGYPNWVTVKDRHKDIITETESIPIGITPFWRQQDGRRPYASQLSQIEAVAGLGLTLRVGLNPGELLDFILGYFGADIYSDDLEMRKQKDKPNQSSEATSLMRAAPQ